MSTRETVAPEIAQGETLSWKRNFTDHPADDGWTVTYYFRGPAGGGIDAAGTPDGKSFEFEVAADDTANFVAGRYDYQAVAVKATDKIVVDEGRLLVVPGLSAVTVETAFDNRTEFQIILAAIDAALKGKATKDQLSYAIGDRELRRYDVAELIKMRQTYQRLRNQEISAEKSKKGLGLTKKYYTRFTPPS